MSSVSWKFLAEEDRLRGESLAQELGLLPLLGPALIRRGLNTSEEVSQFFSPKLEELHNPFLMKNMQEAVDRIVLALEKEEPILVMGDYDVDGITSSALLKDFLFRVGGKNIRSFIPSRFLHGYGLNPKSLEYILDTPPKVLVTVDQGITALEEAAQLQKAGIDAIITDHHTPREEGLPLGCVVNPKQEGCAYPFKELSGCGVAFKLITALRKALRDKGAWSKELPEPNLWDYMDLVAFGTVADVVPLRGENRSLVFHGLRRLNTMPRRLGIQALCQTSGVTGPITSSSIAFQLAPRLNAAGRMAEAGMALELLLCKEADKANQLARKLNNENKKRRQKEQKMLNQANSLLEEDQERGLPSALVVASKDFHEGIIGIVASRLARKYQRPVAVVSTTENQHKCSARSGDTRVNLAEAFHYCREVLQDFGGHAQAAGCTVSLGKLEDFRRLFPAICQELSRTKTQEKECLDGFLPISQIGPDLLNQLELMQPCGHGNSSPTFLIQADESFPEPRIVGGKHLLWELRHRIEMILWNGTEVKDWSERKSFRAQISAHPFRNGYIQITASFF